LNGCFYNQNNLLLKFRQNLCYNTQYSTTHNTAQHTIQQAHSGTIPPPAARKIMSLNCLAIGSKMFISYTLGSLVSKNRTDF